MDPHLYADVVERLDRDGVDAATQSLVLGALGPLSEGGDSPRDIYLRSVTVEGFRGIGPEAKLDIDPGPGLTLVVGRNGSGKSSFAEALELAFTGDNMRWSKRPAIWKGGWRNLHHPSARITVEVTAEGKGVQRLERRWDDDAGLDDTQTHTLKSGARPVPYTPEPAHRPFLSYSELGSMLDEGPSKLYDALATILGLHDLVAAQEQVRQSRLAQEKTVKAAKDALPALLDELRTCEDERAARAIIALTAEPWDLQALDASAGDEPQDLSVLRALSTLEPPDETAAKQAAVRIREAVREVERVQGTDAGQARATAQLLSQALAMHTDGDCPVCGTPGVLHERWRSDTDKEVQRLRALAEEAEDAHGELAQALSKGRGLTQAAPSVLDRASGLGLERQRSDTPTALARSA